MADRRVSVRRALWKLFDLIEFRHTAKKYILHTSNHHVSCTRAKDSYHNSTMMTSSLTSLLVAAPLQSVTYHAAAADTDRAASHCKEIHFTHVKPSCQLHSSKRQLSQFDHDDVITHLATRCCSSTAGTNQAAAADTDGAAKHCKEIRLST